MKLKGEQLRQAWDKLNKEKTKEQIASMIAKTESYWDYVRKYDAVYEINFSEIPLVIEALPDDTDIEKEAISDEFCDYIFAQLTPVQEKVLKLRLEGYSYSEIGKKIDKRAGAVRQIMRKARHKLKNRLYNRDRRYL